MKTRLEKILVDCLCDTLNVMLCSESPGIINAIESVIQPYPFFAFFKAGSAECMRTCIRQVNSWHCLIIDSRCSFTDEFLSVAREFPLWIPVIILADYLSEEFLRLHGISVEQDAASSFQNITINDTRYDYLKLAKEKKCVTVYPFKSIKNLLPLIQAECLKKKLMQRLIPDGVVERSLDILFKQNPLSVDEWSLVLDSTPRKFQRMFKNYTFYSPKKLLALYHAYRIAFETVGNREEFCLGVVSAIVMDERTKKRLLEYVLSRRSQLLAV